MTTETMAMIFIQAIQNTFEENEVTTTIDLDEVNVAEMFTALIMACAYFTHSDDGLLEFTHIANKLAVQRLLTAETQEVTE